MDLSVRTFFGRDELRRSLSPAVSVRVPARLRHAPKRSQESFNGAKSWVKELQRRGDPNVIIALAGNKADLEHRR